MAKFTVSIVYSGSSTFVVDAESSEQAAEFAADRYRNGEEGVQTGGDFEEITSINAESLEG